MHTDNNDTMTPETVAQLLMADLAPIGTITLERRFAGIAVLEDGVMFAFVGPCATAYLRASSATAQRFHALGSTKHPEMRYWSIPHSIAADTATLRQVAYEAADAAHLAFSFGIDDEPPRKVAPVLRTIAALTFLAA